MKVFVIFILLGILTSSSGLTDSEVLLQWRQANPNLQLSTAEGWNGVGSGSSNPCLWKNVTCSGPLVTHLTLNVGQHMTTVPEVVFQELTNVENFVISYNAITGPLTRYVGNLGSQLISTLRIDLSHNNFSGSLPSELKYMTSVRFLYLNNNQFSNSLPYLGDLSGLWRLSLGNNQLSGSLSGVGLENLAQLSSLDLGGNQFTGSFPNIGNLALDYLDISRNQFTGELPDYGTNGNLKTYYADNNQFSGFVPPFLKRYSGELSLHGNNFQCPFPPCDVGYDCTLAKLNLTCTCECHPEGGNCLYQQSGCLCNPGWYGPLCDQQCPGLENNAVCSGHGTCSDGVGGTGLCTCDTINGYGGANCENHCEGILTYPNGTVFCNDHGECVNGICECDEQWDGEECSFCAEGWAVVESACAVECKGGAENPCNGHGTCLKSDGNCDCNEFYSGEACEKYVDVGKIAGLSMMGVILLAILIFVIVVLVGVILRTYYHNEAADLLREYQESAEGNPHRGNRPSAMRTLSRKVSGWFGRKQ